MNLTDNYYTISQLAKELHVTRQTIYRWRKQGLIKGEKIGREFVVAKRTVRKLRIHRLDQLFQAMTPEELKELSEVIKNRLESHIQSFGKK